MGRRSRKLYFQSLLSSQKLQQEATLPPPPAKVEDPAFASGQQTVTQGQAEADAAKREQELADSKAKLAALQADLDAQAKSVAEQKNADALKAAEEAGAQRERERRSADTAVPVARTARDLPPTEDDTGDGTFEQVYAPDDAPAPPVESSSSSLLVLLVVALLGYRFLIRG